MIADYRKRQTPLLDKVLVTIILFEAMILIAFI